MHLNDEQILKLTNIFRETQHPSLQMSKSIAKELNCNLSCVLEWFQNARSRNHLPEPDMGKKRKRMRLIAIPKYNKPNNPLLSANVTTTGAPVSVIGPRSQILPYHKGLPQNFYTMGETYLNRPVGMPIISMNLPVSPTVTNDYLTPISSKDTLEQLESCSRDENLASTAFNVLDVAQIDSPMLFQNSCLGLMYDDTVQEEKQIDGAYIDRCSSPWDWQKMELHNQVPMRKPTIDLTVEEVGKLSEPFYNN